jgi:hypothetical protein
MSRLVIAVLLLLAVRDARAVLGLLTAITRLATTMAANAVPILCLVIAVECAGIAVLAWLTVRQFTPGPAPARAS